MLNEDVFPKLLETFGDQFRNGYFQRLWWAQDGAPAHGSNEDKEWLQEFFRQHTIALNPVEWSPRSPELTPCDYFLWGYLKNKDYVTPPTDIDDLTQRITENAELLKRDPKSCTSGSS